MSDDEDLTARLRGAGPRGRGRRARGRRRRPHRPHRHPQPPQPAGAFGGRGGAADRGRGHGRRRRPQHRQPHDHADRRHAAQGWVAGPGPGGLGWDEQHDGRARGLRRAADEGPHPHRQRCDPAGVLGGVRHARRPDRAAGIRSRHDRAGAVHRHLRHVPGGRLDRRRGRGADLRHHADRVVDDGHRAGRRCRRGPPVRGRPGPWLGQHRPAGGCGPRLDPRRGGLHRTACGLGLGGRPGPAARSRCHHAVGRDRGGLGRRRRRTTRTWHPC